MLTAIWWTNNPVQAWAWGRTNLTTALIFSQPDVLLSLAKFCLLVALGFAIGGGAIYWVMKKIGRASATNLIILGGAVCFVAWFGAQGGLLTGELHTASDAGGVMVKGGAITAHGWEGIFRRSVVAGALGLAMAWVFCLVERVKWTEG